MANIKELIKALEQLPTDCSIPEFNEKLEYDDRILKKIYKEMFGEELHSIEGDDHEV